MKASAQKIFFGGLISCFGFYMVYMVYHSHNYVRWISISIIQPATSLGIFQPANTPNDAYADNGKDTVIGPAKIPGLIWPRVNESNERILNQLEFSRKYAEMKGNRTKTKVILRVGNFNFNDLHWADGKQKMIADNCPIQDCRFTSDHSEAKIADVVVISEMNKDLVKKFLPKPSHQVWVTQHLESPLHNRIDASSVKDLVNWTASYRPDSTLVLVFATWNRSKVPITVDNHHQLPSINYAEGRTKKVVWMVSNCADRNGRKSYAKELAKHISVDIYGGCGTLSCPKGTNDDCWGMLKKNYKFYLAFENSNCDGYITEKFHYYALWNDLIPIVMGPRREYYVSVAPTPHKSFIHVDDFASPRHLAIYLDRLDKNDTLYNEYFWWKKDIPLMGIDAIRYWCRLCMLAHLKDDLGYVHWYEDYERWWNGACNAYQAEGQDWQTWRPPGYWNKTNS